MLVTLLPEKVPELEAVIGTVLPRKAHDAVNRVVADPEVVGPVGAHEVVGPGVDGGVVANGPTSRVCTGKDRAPWLDALDGVVGDRHGALNGIACAVVMRADRRADAIKDAAVDGDVGADHTIDVPVIVVRRLAKGRIDMNGLVDIAKASVILAVRDAVGERAPRNDRIAHTVEDDHVVGTIVNECRILNAHVMGLLEEEDTVVVLVVAVPRTTGDGDVAHPAIRRATQVERPPARREP